MKCKGVICQGLQLKKMKKWMIGCFAFFLYTLSLWGGFVQDDVRVILEDRDMGSVGALAAVWSRPYYYADEASAGIYRPLTSFSFYLNALITGLSPWGFRLVNVLLYACLCGFVYFILKKLGLKKAWIPALFFAVLPVHTEAVNNIVGRAEILSLGFALVVVWSLLKKKWEVAGGVFLLALFSKETAMILLAVMIYFVLTSKEPKETKIGVILFYFLLAGGYWLLRTVALGGGGVENSATLVENPLKFVPAWQRVATAFALVTVGLGKVFLPVNLSYDYSFTQIKPVDGWLEWGVIGGVLLAGLSVVSLLTRLRKERLWVLGQAFFWGPLAITGNFLFPVGTVFGERLWFWPSLGVVILLSFCCRHILGARRNIFPGVGYAILVTITVLFALRTVVRNVDWLSQERLFIHDARYVKDSVLAQTNAAAMYLMKGDRKTGKEYMERADAIYPWYPELLNNWGMFYLQNGEREKAKEKFARCLRERPGYWLCEENMKLSELF